MRPDSDVARIPPRQTAHAPHFQLRAGAIFWRACVIAFVVREYGVWRYVSKFVPKDEPVRRVVGFLIHSPKSFYVALLIGVGVTLAMSIGFRLIVRPLMRRWYHPRPFDTTYTHPLPFKLSPGEVPVAEWPARQLEGLSTLPGTFIRTNRNVWFFPFAWDREPWGLALDRVTSARTEPKVRRVLGFVRGYPDPISLSDAQGANFRLIVANPREVLGALRADSNLDSNLTR